MPSTVPYGFEFEHPVDDEPGRTLDGGDLGGSPILAEQVNDELARIDTDLSDALARLDLLEAGTSMVGWVPIQASVGSVGAVADFDIDLTDGGRFSVGEFALLRLHMRYDLDETDGRVTMRINNDSSAVYRTAMRAVDAANANPAGTDPADIGVDVLQFFDPATQWFIGYGGTVATNNLVCTIFHTDGNFAHGYQATSTRQSSSATTHAWAEAWGALSATLSAAPSSLRVFARTPTAGLSSFSNAWWWMEGYRST